MPLIRKAFKRLHYTVDIIARCVHWYLAYALSLRNLEEEMMTERGIIVDHSTLHRWVIRLVPLLDKAFRRHKRSVGRRWRMDETYINVKGQWKYLYRAVDTEGQTIDFLLTAGAIGGAGRFASGAALTPPPFSPVPRRPPVRAPPPASATRRGRR